MNASRKRVVAHSWKRAVGGWSCKKCGVFRSTERIYFPKGKAATKREPRCEA